MIFFPTTKNISLADKKKHPYLVTERKEGNGYSNW